MTTNLSDTIQNIRFVSRNLIRELGFLNKTIAGTGLPGSFVHAIVEIGTSGELTAKELSERLLLEKSTISRLVRSLIEREEISESRSLVDARQKNLRLTEKGEKTLTKINHYAASQVREAISPLSESKQQEIFTGLASYCAALQNARNKSPSDTQISPPENLIEIRRGYLPGIIGDITSLHATYYNSLVGFGDKFETAVATGLTQFIPRLENKQNEIWSIVQSDKILGSIAIDGEDLGAGIAHLRWFILDKKLQGTGIGKTLLKTALQFCDTQKFNQTHLWTFKGLDTARALYEQNGFSLMEEYSGTQWGKQMTEQKFVRSLPSKGNA
ncbi:helix-turn-helix domain-containing GNAT family N-acetyltransferase [Kiloniella laminariae]|uniref:Helix-turn-helix domain-containing GNAT family N-acetyltransferase n=1 Tax=Kiloniella laminariae TaxID=454162 RepID=A0ABT4LGE5_9PROT|nr:helix-turn-helix domain-containing GNAT family N-acetyltransferase [Kiloniella laminariae]MCZ4280175.1 helix-turn-helix domain-containing GNAT family N-acetyltransferase [Kiloniella laminariae]